MTSWEGLVPLSWSRNHQRYHFEQKGRLCLRWNELFVGEICWYVLRLGLGTILRFTEWCLISIFSLYFEGFSLLFGRPIWPFTFFYGFWWFVLRWLRNQSSGWAGEDGRECDPNWQLRRPTPTPLPLPYQVISGGGLSIAQSYYFIIDKYTASIIQSC